MRTLRPRYPLVLLCRVLAVSRSGYPAWRSRRPSKWARESVWLEVAIRAAPVRTRQTYGPAHFQVELREDGFSAGVGRIKRLRKTLGLRCTQVRRFMVTTDSTHRLPVADNLLAQVFTATRPNEMWVTDIAMAEGCVYLVRITDLYTREVIGHAMGTRMTTDLVGHAVGNAVEGKRLRPGLIHHSDRGAILPPGLSGSTATVRHDPFHESEGELLW